MQVDHRVQDLLKDHFKPTWDLGDCLYGFHIQTNALILTGWKVYEWQCNNPLKDTSMGKDESRDEIQDTPMKGQGSRHQGSIYILESLSLTLYRI